jgi:NadR type nicotinamide-nucleotide adenylyltransferase
VIRICFHGAESTGKTMLARKLRDELACPVVPEYGRGYAEIHGTDFTMADLLNIARGQDRLMHEAAASAPRLLLLDTDPLMTAAWAEMLFGSVPTELLGYPKAEQYLLFAPGTPWLADGTRMFGGEAERKRFADIAEKMLVSTGVPYREIGGDWTEREFQARRAIEQLG